MKTIYENAKMEIIAFESEDVIATSGLSDLLGDDDAGMGKLN